MAIGRALSVYLILALVQVGLSLNLGSPNGSVTTYLDTTTIQPEPTQNETSILVDELPEPFMQEKLPGAETDTDWCDNEEHIGCFKKIAAVPDAEQPEKMKAAFNVFSNKQEVLIEYKPKKHCLRKNATDCAVYPYDLGLINKSNFNPELRTIIVVPGFKSGQFDKFLYDIKDGWNALEEVNFIMVAWTGGNRAGGIDINYPQAVANTRVVARQIAVLLYYLGVMKSDYQLSDDNYVNQVSMVGHSLGAHISGFVGKDLNGGLGSIAGLDPAGPAFRHRVSRFRLDRSDAILVQTIHTNTKTLGIPEAIGNLDFYANEGEHQPGCRFKPACSHSRSHDYYISFLKHEKRMRDLAANMSMDSLENHKLYAFQSPDYRQFVDGTSRRKLCPKSVLDDKTFDRSDINRCITPMDFVSDPDTAIQNLEAYGIDVKADSEAGKSRKFYFHTQEAETYLNNHFMFKIYFAKDRKVGAQCKINVDLKQPDGKMKNYKVGYYSLYENQGHLEANIPIMGSNLESKYALAEVDANDYYTSDVELLEKLARVIFPTSIRIKGKLLSQNRSATPDNDITDWCNLQIESIHMEPLNQLNRYFSASFSVGAKGKKYPDVVFQDELSQLDRKQEFVRLGAVSDAYLDIVVVGRPKTPEVYLKPSAVETYGSYAMMTLTGMIFVGLIVVSTLAIVIDRKWLHRRSSSSDTQPIVGNN